jgi:hypothetical protein
MNITDDREELPAQTASLRSTWRCLIWLILTLASLSIVFFKDEPILTIMAFLFMLYGLESFVTEAFGVSVDQTGITIPKQLLPRVPWIVFWRQRNRWEEIERINSISGDQVRLIMVNGRTDMNFKDRDEKLEFFKVVKTFCPSMRIQKGN